jgi:hypothetical protein
MRPRNFDRDLLNRDKRKALQERRNGLAAQKEFLAAENG